MNPNDKKDKKNDPSEEPNKPELDKPESVVVAYQEPEKPQTQPPSQSGEAMLSNPSAKKPSLAELRRMAASYEKGNVPDFIKELIACLPRIKLSKRGLPPRICPPKKRKLSHLKTAPKSKPGHEHETEPDPDPSDPYPDAESPYLFDVLVTNSYCLPISYELAENYFPGSKSKIPFDEETIQLTDPSNRLWSGMKYVSFDAEEAFILTKHWVQYCILCNLHYMDTVRFLRPENPLGPNHFVTQHFHPLPDSQPVEITLPEFLPQNFLFQVELEHGDVSFERLAIGGELVRLHFPGIQKQEMLKLTDYRGKGWYVTMLYTEFGDKYMVVDRWGWFVQEHTLGIGDRVRFYKPDMHAHNRHFYIQFVKKEDENKQPGSGQSSDGSKDKGKGIAYYC